MNEWVGSIAGMVLTGENRTAQRKTCPSATLSITWAPAAKRRQNNHPIRYHNPEKKHNKNIHHETPKSHKTNVSHIFNTVCSEIFLRLLP